MIPPSGGRHKWRAATAGTATAVAADTAADRAGSGLHLLPHGVHAFGPSRVGRRDRPEDDDQRVGGQIGPEFGAVKLECRAERLLHLRPEQALPHGPDLVDHEMGEKAKHHAAAHEVAVERFFGTEGKERHLARDRRCRHAMQHPPMPRIVFEQPRQAEANRQGDGHAREDHRLEREPPLLKAMDHHQGHERRSHRDALAHRHSRTVVEIGKHAGGRAEAGTEGAGRRVHAAEVPRGRGIASAHDGRAGNMHADTGHEAIPQRLRPLAKGRSPGVTTGRHLPDSIP
jgi:hypothetical protein